MFKLSTRATLRAIMTMLLFVVHELSDAGAADPPVSKATAGDAKSAPAMPPHFLLNPDRGRPPDYPDEISIENLQSFLKNRQVMGQGCGGMTWEGTACGMFCNSYSVANTPWLKDRVASEVCYARTDTGTFIASFMLGTNRYGREDRGSDKLTWDHNYAPDEEKDLAEGILLGRNSEKRKEILARIQESFRNLDLRVFPYEARQMLVQQLKRCETDPDPVVVALAKQLRRALTFDVKPTPDGG